MKIIVIAVIIFSLTACGGSSSNSHENGTTHGLNTHTHADGSVHEGAAHSESGKPMPATDAHDHAHNETIQLTAYNADFELFAEATPFVAGQTGDIHAHFSRLENFKRNLLFEPSHFQRERRKLLKNVATI